MKKIFKILIFVCVVFFIIGFVRYKKNNKIYNMLTDDYKQKYYINELYESKEINYRLILNKREKKLYDFYINKIINFENNFSFDLSEYDYTYSHEYFEKISKINRAVMMDHPELIYFGYPEMSKQKNSKIVTIKIHYIMNKEEYLKNIKMIKNQIENIKNETINMDEYSKVKYVYEYLGNKNNYGNQSDPVSQSAYAAFNDNLSPVCAGYGRASQIIFNNIGVTSMLISGDLKSTWLTGDSHEWNVVKIKNQYYIYDVTQSSILKGTTGKISYVGFLTKNKSIYSAEYKKSNPYINGKEYDYYEMNNLVYSYNRKKTNELKSLLKNKYTELKMKNISDFKNDYSDIKMELNLKTYYVIDDIVVLEKNN